MGREERGRHPARELDLLPGVRNLNVSVREVGEQIVFLRRLEEGLDRIRQGVENL